MYRITSDVHDNWGAVRGGFAASTLYGGQGLAGAPGLNGRSWPQHDMLPLGFQKNQTGLRANGLSPDEQRTLMTLWSITRSPLIYVAAAWHLLSTILMRNYSSSSAVPSHRPSRHGS